MTAITKFYCDNSGVLLGIRLGNLYGAEAPIAVPHVLKSDNPVFNYMLMDKDPLCSDQIILEFLSREGERINYQVMN
jgi:hypothetical protein